MKLKGSGFQSNEQVQDSLPVKAAFKKWCFESSLEVPSLPPSLPPSLEVDAHSQVYSNTCAHSQLALIMNEVALAVTVLSQEFWGYFFLFLSPKMKTRRDSSFLYNNGIGQCLERINCGRVFITQFQLN